MSASVLPCTFCGQPAFTSIADTDACEDCEKIADELIKADAQGYRITHGFASGVAAFVRAERSAMRNNFN